MAKKKYFKAANKPLSPFDGIAWCLLWYIYVMYVILCEHCTMMWVTRYPRINNMFMLFPVILIQSERHSYVNARLDFLVDVLVGLLLLGDEDGHFVEQSVDPLLPRETLLLNFDLPASFGVGQRLLAPLLHQPDRFVPPRQFFRFRLCFYNDC